MLSFFIKSVSISFFKTLILNLFFFFRSTINYGIKIVKAAIPTVKDLKLFISFSFVFLIGLTFVYFFNYLSPAYASSSGKVVDSVPDSILDYLTYQVSGCVGMFNFATVNTTEFSPLTQSTGVGRSAYARCISTFPGQNTKSSSGAVESSPRTSFMLMDFGATGMVLNASSSLYATTAVPTFQTVAYYASNIRGNVYADSPVSGRNALAPIFVLNQNLVNLAYGLIVVLLVFSSFFLLMANLTGGNVKITIVQIVINAVVTLVVVTFYYEIAAVIYDLTINYANALVAGFMSPFVNSIVMLERLSPGGDLSIVNVLNAYQFVGVTDGFITVINSILYNILPLLAQSSVAAGEALGGKGLDGNPAATVTGTLMGFFGGLGSIFQAGVLTSFLGSAQIFTTIIAWAIFLINIKIFLNLITAFITFSLITAFGPLIALGGVQGGFDAIVESFKNLAANGLVFPFTFLFILLAGVLFNLFIPEKDAEYRYKGIAKVELCRFSPSDPAYSAIGVVNRFATGVYISGLGGNMNVMYNPAAFKMKHTIHQDIIDVVPASYITVDGVQYRDCRPSLFPVPWTFVPAPFGTVGQRQLSVVTIDSFMRTVLGIVTLLMAARVPDILKQALGVRDLGSLVSIEGAFSEGFQKTLSTGFQGLGLGFKAPSMLLMGSVGTWKLASKVPLIGGMLSKLSQKLTSKKVATNLSQLYQSSFGKYNAIFQNKALARRLAYEDVKKKLEAPTEKLLMGQNLIETVQRQWTAQLQEATNQLIQFTEAVGNVVNGLSQFAAQLDILNKKF